MSREWQPIETAPRDGTVIDLWVTERGYPGERITDCQWSTRTLRGGAIREGWGWGPSDDPEFVSGDVTHWMPPPEPPS